MNTDSSQGSSERKKTNQPARDRQKRAQEKERKKKERQEEELLRKLPDEEDIDRAAERGERLGTGKMIAEGTKDKEDRPEDQS